MTNLIDVNDDKEYSWEQFKDDVKWMTKLEFIIFEGSADFQFLIVKNFLIFAQNLF